MALSIHHLCLENSENILRFQSLLKMALVQSKDVKNYSDECLVIFCRGSNRLKSLTWKAKEEKFGKFCKKVFP